MAIHPGRSTCWLGLGAWVVIARLSIPSRKRKTQSWVFIAGHLNELNPSRQPRAQMVDLLLQLLKLAIEDALVVLVVGVFDSPADRAGFQFKSFDFGDDIGL